ncbi:PEGA domain-containing protein [Candidatus Woesearchaeota archaeon]|nr:PEGA domain-containing protein [Candidatus Woesearchaeota archaeon]
MLSLSFNSDVKLVTATNHTNQTQTGNLYVQTIPNIVDIYVDSIYRGVSPVTVYNLNVGSHTIRATKLGYQDAFVTANVEAGKTTSVYITLQPITQQGNISVTTDPIGANIYLDELFKGVTAGPLLISGVTVGNHTVKASKPSYFNASKVVSVSDGQTTIVHLILIPVNSTNIVPTGSLFVTTNPWGAAIHIDGQFKGLTQSGTLLVENVPSGTRVLKITKSGYLDYMQTINIVQSATTYVNATLTRSTYACYDTDNGLDYYVKGTVTVRQQDNNITQQQSDFCSDTITLNEYYCATGSSIASKAYTCPYGCAFGACKKFQKIESKKVALASNNWILWTLLIIVAAFFIAWKSKQIKISKGKKKKGKK